jgi:hypothetical protein
MCGQECKGRNARTEGRKEARKASEGRKEEKPVKEGSKKSQ